MRRIPILVLSLVFAAAISARADTVQIDFDFGGSVMSFLGAATIPPDGTIHSMGARSSRTSRST
jgi:hypothetical protein